LCVCVCVCVCVLSEQVIIGTKLSDSKTV